MKINNFQTKLFCLFWYLLHNFVIFSPVKRSLQLSDDEDESLKKSKDQDEHPVLE